jgi:hypothetical protein
VIRVAAAATSAGTFRSNVRVSADSTDPSAANDFAEISTTVMAPAAPDPQPQPDPQPPAAAPAKRGGGGGMDLVLLSMLALLAASRVVLLRKSRCGRYSQS